MNEDVKPALTAARWENLCVQGECRADEIWWRVHGYDPHDPDERAIDDLPHHEIAAIALHNQPYGFTWSDVDDLLRRAELEEDSTVYHGVHQQSRLRRLAARIAALLPPRQTPETT